MAAYKQVGALTQLGISFAAIYTCPAGATAEISAIGTINETTTAQTVTYSIVRANGGANEEIVTAQSVPAKNTVPGAKLTVHFEAVGQVLMPGDILQAKASLAASLRPWTAFTVRT